jgi:uncharacterized membrane protein YgdD (TMEM256/DUF423 family)
VRPAACAALVGALAVVTGAAGAAGLPATPAKLKAKYLHGRARLKKLLLYLER